MSLMCLELDSLLIGKNNLADGFFVSPVRAEKICYLSPDWFSFDSHVLVGGGDREV